MATRHNRRLIVSATVSFGPAAAESAEYDMLKDIVNKNAYIFITSLDMLLQHTIWDPLYRYFYCTRKPTQRVTAVRV